MNQVSKPMRIALGAVLLLGVVWFVALRPKTEEAVPPVTPPAQQGETGLTDRPGQAESAVNDANAKNSAAEQQADKTGSSSGGTQAAPQTGNETAPKTESPSKVTPPSKSTDPSAAIIASAQKGNMEVVLFWDPAGSDDRHVMRAVKEVNTRNNSVKIHTVEIKDVGKYTSLTQDVAVNVAPTLIILSPKLQAWRITGYTDTAEINGLVGAIARRSD